MRCGRNESLNGCAGGCLGRTLVLVLLAVAVAAAWRFGPELAERVAEMRSAEPPGPSPELAEGALDRYAELASGRTERVSLSGVELESILRFHLSEHLPPGVTDPGIRIRDGEVRASLRVALALIPTIPDLEGIRDVLPDPVPIELTGLVVTLEGSRTIFIVRRVEAGGVPIPRRFHSAVAAAIDPERSEDVPAEAITIPLPDDVRSLRIEGDALVVTGTG